ncbi:hypothetical protein BD311DRAFT_659626 [Dichomitus squalens]|uniref:HIT-type domain-containing protein n=1 Tax=Dichomitus squalens TaxID=114155 RepID=A0A4V2K0T8_9APHY|nr:hypothetical protein BD311DRAFT_659626 [Dichomitus squalens]
MAEEQLQEPIIASSSRESESVSSTPCVICRRQFARYTCPRCNIPYCSLVCFRSEKHGDCSESFYRKEVELDVKSAPSASAEEKRRMMELLKRFEEDSLDDSPLLDDTDNEDEDGADDLQRRLQSIDLDTASYDELWNALTLSEREKFLRAVDNPNSESAQQLLASEELEKVQVEPWWEPQPPSNEISAPSDAAVPNRNRGARPSIVQIPESLVKQVSNNAASGPLLLYNICALCIAYAYTVRYFAVSPLSAISRTDPDYAEVRESISRLAPFLVDRRSTTVHLSLSAVVTDLWSRFPASHVDSRSFSLLLKDTATILRPATVTVVASQAGTTRDLEEHPSANVLRVLSDLSSLFTLSQSDIGEPSASPAAQQRKAKPNHVVHKLTFYAAYIICTPAPTLRVLADEATMHAKMLENEAKQARQNRDGGEVKRVRSDRGSAPRIEEL